MLKPAQVVATEEGAARRCPRWPAEGAREAGRTEGRLQPAAVRTWAPSAGSRVWQPRLGTPTVGSPIPGFWGRAQNPAGN